MELLENEDQIVQEDLGPGPSVHLHNYHNTQCRRQYVAFIVSPSHYYSLFVFCIFFSSFSRALFEFSLSVSMNSEFTNLHEHVSDSRICEQTVLFNFRHFSLPLPLFAFLLLCLLCIPLLFSRRISFFSTIVFRLLRNSSMNSSVQRHLMLPTTNLEHGPTTSAAVGHDEYGENSGFL